MNFLLDTHVILWAASQSKRLPRDIRDLFEDAENKLFYSAASFFEINIKRALARPDFTVEPAILRRGLDENGYIELPIKVAHTLALDSLPPTEFLWLKRSRKGLR